MRFNYNPDVLEAIANLSNDEVFTPPKLANTMLDLLPKELWSDSSIKILDPATKSWVFLREAAKRLIKGLEKEIPNLQERINHICTKQLFGIAITELTSLLTRRSLYCSKYANGKYSITTSFQVPEGNIRYNNIDHIWENGYCKQCWATENIYKRDEELESYAYNFIHLSPEDILALFWGESTMKFDVIIWNPPYQLKDGGQGASAKPIYHFFIQQAKKLNPRYLSMIIPARRFIGGKGLDNFREEMINDHNISILHDFVDSKQIFNGVDIKGGVCYFLREKDEEKPCEYHLHDETGEQISTRFLAEGNAGIVIRYQECIDILKKVQKLWETSLATIISSRKPYWLATDFFKDPKKYWKPDTLSDKPIANGMTIHGLVNLKRTKKYVDEDYPITQWGENLNKYKILITKSYWSWTLGEEIPAPILAKPMELCTETFIEMWGFIDLNQTKNALSYLKTKFLRFLVGIKKTTQDAPNRVYQLVPIQDFTEKRTDQKLYQKYWLSTDEINFIENMIAPME